MVQKVEDSWEKQNRSYKVILFQEGIYLRGQTGEYTDRQDSYYVLTIKGLHGALQCKSVYLIVALIIITVLPTYRTL